MSTQHWQLYVSRTDSAVPNYDKTGQLCTSPHSSGLLHERRSPTSHQSPPKTLPYRHHTSQHTPCTLHPPHMQTDTPPQPPSTCPPTTLRNHHPCQVQADPAILSATVRVSWCRVSCSYCWGFNHHQMRSSWKVGHREPYGVNVSQSPARV